MGKPGGVGPLPDLALKPDGKRVQLCSFANAEADQIIDARGLRQLDDSSAIEALVDKALADNAGPVARYRATDPDKRVKLFGFFVGQVMKASMGKANPQQVNELLRRKLDGE